MEKFPRLKINLQPNGNGAGAGQFVVNVQRVEMVILSSHVEQAGGQFRLAVEETPAGKEVELPEVVARFGGSGGIGIAAVALIEPQGLALGKKSAGMIVNRGQVQLVAACPASACRGWKSTKPPTTESGTSTKLSFKTASLMRYFAPNAQSRPTNWLAVI